MDYSQLASADQISLTIKSLAENGITATLDTIGLTRELNESGRYATVRAKLYDESVSKSEKRKLGGGPDWTIGSVHALTEDGKLIIASNTGSQLGAYGYGAGQVVWVIGAQKIVKNIDTGMKRVYDYVLPIESERAHKAYGVPGSFVSKILIFNREVTPDRIHVIIVNEQLGF